MLKLANLNSFVNVLAICADAKESALETGSLKKQLKKVAFIFKKEQSHT